jgi:uncharacterized protein (DUF2235 family)
MKKIVVLSDGTGNSREKRNKTNVWRIWKALDLTEEEGGIQTVARYDDGVGSSTFRLGAIVAGAIGYGLKRNVLSLYRFLCIIYEPGDQIYAFGFSRGAYTIQTLVGLLASQGLVVASSDRELNRLARAAFNEFCGETTSNFGWIRLARAARAKLHAALSRLLRRQEYRKEKNRAVGSIRFLGLWDAVGAYGLPIEEPRRAWERYMWPLPVPLPAHVLAKKCNVLVTRSHWTTNVQHSILFSGRRTKRRLPFPTPRAGPAPGTTA